MRAGIPKPLDPPSPTPPPPLIPPPPPQGWDEREARLVSTLRQLSPDREVGCHSGGFRPASPWAVGSFVFEESLGENCRTIYPSIIHPCFYHSIPPTFFIFIHLPIHPLIYCSHSLSLLSQMCPSIHHFSIHPSIDPFSYPSIDRFFYCIFLSIHSSIFPSVHPSIFPSILLLFLLFHPCMYRSFHPSIFFYHLIMHVYIFYPSTLLFRYPILLVFQSIYISKEVTVALHLFPFSSSCSRLLTRLNPFMYSKSVAVDGSHFGWSLRGPCNYGVGGLGEEAARWRLLAGRRVAMLCSLVSTQKPRLMFWSKRHWKKECCM